MRQHELSEIAASHVNDILSIAIQHHETHSAVVVYDKGCELACILSAAYQRCLPKARFINFEDVRPDFVLEAFAPLKPADLVVLIQSTSFRLEAFRIRVELFKRGLKVIEHPHLSRMSGEEISYYIESLAYDPHYFRKVGHELKKRIDQACGAIIDSGEGARLFFDSAFEPAKLNIGDYSEMTNIGGQFPIGEVFSEAQNLEAVHGQVRIFVFGDTKFMVNRPEQAITLVIDKGRVKEVKNSTPEFDLVLRQIREDEGEIWLRELGFGMNRAFSTTRTVSDIGTYERMCGIHLSLGAKHGVFNKAQIRRANARYHVDIFPITNEVILNNLVIYRDGSWLV